MQTKTGPIATPPVGQNPSLDMGGRDDYRSRDVASNVLTARKAEPLRTSP
jgi:hypothetical protein